LEPVFFTNSTASKKQLEAQGPGTQLTADNHAMTVPNFMQNIKTSDIIIRLPCEKQGKYIEKNYEKSF
jgi:hypothetical protein